MNKNAILSRAKTIFYTFVCKTGGMPCEIAFKQRCVQKGVMPYARVKNISL